jgi:hypothetical protein
MIRIALAVVASVGLTFAADAQTYHVHRHYVHYHHYAAGGYHPGGGMYHGVVSGVGPLCQDPHGSLLVCSSRYGGVSEVGPLCQDPHGILLVCYSNPG